MNLLTVVIPVRNRAGIVGRTLASIDAQSVAPAKVVLVDNGSTDNTMQVLRQWADGRENVVIASEPRPGAAAARNRGLAEVNTPYVYFFDSDDTMSPTMIEDITEGLKRENMPPLATFDIEHQSIDGRISMMAYRKKGDPVINHLFHACLATMRTVVLADEVRRAGGWDEELPAWNDLEMGIRLALRNTPVWLPMRQPGRNISGAESITGTGFSQKAGVWEKSLDRIETDLRASRPELAPLVDYRRAILAGNYRREGATESAEALLATIRHRPLLMRAICRYVAAGGRGVAIIANLLH